MLGILDPNGGSEEEDFFRVLADGAPVMIWMSGLDLGCFYFNRAWLEFRGRTLDEERGNGWAEGVHPADLNSCIQHYVGSFEQRQPFAMSYRLRNAAGQYRWILDRGAPHFLPDGTFLGFFGGCAESEANRVVTRNAELGAQLAQMREAAREVAVETGALFQQQTGMARAPGAVGPASIDPHLERLRRRNRAAHDMEQLASDMMLRKSIPNGARLKS